MRVKKKRFNPAKAKRKLDRLFSEAILLRDNRTCQWCGINSEKAGKPIKIDNSHIIPREVLATRWNVNNSTSLCFAHHKLKRLESWHGSPLVAVRWLRRKYGDAYCDELLEQAVQPFELNEKTASEIERGLKEFINGL